ncbi:peroxiredoxin-like family protein [Neotamlana laminarinivorans]|uniref:thioredoxin-dependent peroxiredoxin n=1 Tax=Neotamlana laminarinivorans TaxID=2883124 RepID=A0A9X1HZX2_9FLAO|nr:peroxiredoxin-like family protein [Tamlana laminarinivorans]MCB4798033.1 AhpC/TSA family protein [Tamlana laminarinivorans]
MSNYKNQTEALNAHKDSFSKKADKTTKKVYSEGLNAVTKSGVLQAAKKIGDIAPEFSLKNAVGEIVTLKQFLEKGPVVLVWYRGGWCPYCNINLQYLQQELPNFKAEGANLLALTPELPDASISASEKHSLKFEVLSDVGNKVAKNYGVVFKLTNDVANIYNTKFDLTAYNGDSSNELPLAATYIINKKGVIEHAFLSADYRERAEPSDITTFLKKM